MRNQNNKDVFFLAGSLAIKSETNRVFPPNFPPRRSCVIPAGKSILFPIINCESNLLEHPELKSKEEIIRRVRKDEDTIVKKECVVDGISIPAQRVSSDPLVFELDIVGDNLFDVNSGGVTEASADGYWVFLKPLSKGKHLISFEGSCEFGLLNTGAIYSVEIT